MTDMSAMKIANVIHDVKRKHEAYRAARMEAVELATNLGMEQKEAMKGSKAIEWLDAFLAGSGCLPDHRRQP